MKGKRTEKGGQSTLSYVAVITRARLGHSQEPGAASGFSPAWQGSAEPSSGADQGAREPEAGPQTEQQGLELALPWEMSAPCPPYPGLQWWRCLMTSPW